RDRRAAGDERQQPSGRREHERPADTGDDRGTGRQRCLHIAQAVAHEAPREAVTEPAGPEGQRQRDDSPHRTLLLVGPTRPIGAGFRMAPPPHARYDSSMPPATDPRVLRLEEELARVRRAFETSLDA